MSHLCYDKSLLYQQQPPSTNRQTWFQVGVQVMALLGSVLIFSVRIESRLSRLETKIEDAEQSRIQTVRQIVELQRSSQDLQRLFLQQQIEQMRADR